MGKWFEVRKCPGCSSSKFSMKGNLPDFHYSFGEETISFPLKKINIVSCDECGLTFKTMLPSSDYLFEIFSRQGNSVWSYDYDYKIEKKTILKTITKKSFDLLDVGSSDGRLLNSFSDYGGRRSGLDPISFPSFDNNLRGEFIKSRLDDNLLKWSKQPYDVITLFDVLEHLYNPSLAFYNLNKLVKPQGLIFIETGDTNSYFPHKFGLNNWWYIRLCDHHIFWNSKSISFQAKTHGFSILSINHIRHKTIRKQALPYKIKHFMASVLWQLSPSLFVSLAQKLGKKTNQPKDPFRRDHLRIILQKD